MGSEAKIPPANRKPQMQSGIVPGDCLEVLRFLDAESVDLTVFSPPYDNIRDYREEWAVDFSALGEGLFRVVKDGGVCAVVIGDGTKNFAKSMTTFKLAVDWCRNAGWSLFECCIYQRDGNPGAWWNRRFRVDHEYILLFCKGGKPGKFNKTPLMIPSKHAGKIYAGTDRLTSGELKKIPPKTVNARKCRGTVWRYATSNSEGNKLKLKHPATYPDKLAEDLILCFSESGDMVLDPMCGSGTTCIMAAKNHRKYFGIEISREYCEIAERRMRAELKQRNFSLMESSAGYSGKRQ